MSYNSFGNLLKLTTYGESHGSQIGGILDGMPAGIKIDISKIQFELDRRRPGQSKITTDRNETDTIEVLSGIYQGQTTGHSIGFQIANKNQKKQDYSHNEDVFRPSHADFTYFNKYGIRDPFGSGRASARETANWVTAGAIAKQLIPQIQIVSFVSQVGKIKLNKPYQELDLNSIDSNIVRCPDSTTSIKMIEYIDQLKMEGDSTGGVITCIVKNMPIGLGEPIFHKLEAELAKAMLTINATKGFEIGSGFEGAEMNGSSHNDIFNNDGSTKTNFSGGIQGGISNGMEIVFRVAFKPVATIMKVQPTIDQNLNPVLLEGKGRHDPCVLPRAVPIVDAMTSLVLADLYLINKTRKF